MRVRFGPRALRHLGNIREWITEQADTETANRILSELVGRCDALTSFPRRGTPRNDIQPGLRTIVHNRRYTISYIVHDGEVVIVGIRSAGQDDAPLTTRPN